MGGAGSCLATDNRTVDIDNAANREGYNDNLQDQDGGEGIQLTARGSDLGAVRPSTALTGAEAGDGEEKPAQGYPGYDRRSSKDRSGSRRQTDDPTPNTKRLGLGGLFPHSGVNHSSLPEQPPLTEQMISEFNAGCVPSGSTEVARRREENIAAWKEQIPEDIPTELLPLSRHSASMQALQVTLRKMGNGNAGGGHHRQSKWVGSNAAVAAS